MAVKHFIRSMQPQGTAYYTTINPNIEVLHKCVKSHLIGTWIGDIDDTSCQFCLQVVDECSFKSLSLVYDIVLISSTRQSEEKTEITVTLQRDNANI